MIAAACGRKIMPYGKDNEDPFYGSCTRMILNGVFLNNVNYSAIRIIMGQET